MALLLRRPRLIGPAPGASIRLRSPLGIRHTGGVARVELERKILAEGLLPAKVQSLQLAPVEVSDNGTRMVIEGPDIVVARAWVVDPEAWKALPKAVTKGRVALFDATQMKVADEGGSQAVRSQDAHWRRGPVLPR